jgi:hypothetical protein
MLPAVDALIREFSAQGLPGMEITRLVNAKLGIDWGYQNYWHRMKKHIDCPWIFTQRAGRPVGRGEYLAKEKWKACYEDPGYEARMPEIWDKVICRECLREALDGKRSCVAFLKGNSLTKHLADVHGMKNRRDYRCLHPCAPMYSCEVYAFLRYRGQYRRLQTHAPSWRKLYDTFQQNRELVEKCASERAQRYATPEERLAAVNEPDYYEKRLRTHVICLIERCGEKTRHLWKHLLTQHDGMTTKAYRRQRPGARMIPIEALDKAREKGRDARKRTKQALAALERPKDWFEKPMDWRIIGTELLSQKYMDNAELGERLEESRILKCPYGPSWCRALSGAHKNRSAVNFISDIRAWVNRPAKPAKATTQVVT